MTSTFDYKKFILKAGVSNIFFVSLGKTSIVIFQHIVIEAVWEETRLLRLFWAPFSGFKTFGLFKETSFLLALLQIKTCMHMSKHAKRRKADLSRREAKRESDNEGNKTRVNWSLSLMDRTSPLHPHEVGLWAVYLKSLPLGRKAASCPVKCVYTFGTSFRGTTLVAWYEGSWKREVEGMAVNVHFAHPSFNTLFSTLSFIYFKVYPLISYKITLCSSVLVPQGQKIFANFLIIIIDRHISWYISFKLSEHIFHVILTYFLLLYTLLFCLFLLHITIMLY